jgi:hypothetical protein
MEKEKEFKTPSYQRKAYRAYLERNKDNQEFIQKRRKAQREYYHKKLKKTKSIKSDDIVSVSSM